MKPIQAAEEICTYLDWDSRLFDRRIARLNRRRLDEASLGDALDWCKSNRIECLYFLADSDDATTSCLAEQNGFQQTDVRITLERTLEERDVTTFTEKNVRLARPEDTGALRAIARTVHRDSRFYFDQHFEREKCGFFYETWIENSIAGFAQAVLVVEVNENPVGYITCHLQDRESQIGLAGIAEKYQKMGLGGKLTEGFLAWSVQKGARRSTVVTQGRNVRAQRLYQCNGFVTESVKLWYHRWFSK
jgi:dTDP-4-amino-4,6-dideoxy-D-galactose acyltransferase